MFSPKADERVVLSRKQMLAAVGCKGGSKLIIVPNGLEVKQVKAVP